MMTRYAVLGIVSLTGILMSVSATAQAETSDAATQGHFLLAKGQESMGSKQLNDSFIDMTPNADDRQQEQERNATDSQSRQSDDTPDDDETQREPVKWRDKANLKAYLNNDEDLNDSAIDMTSHTDAPHQQQDRNAAGRPSRQTGDTTDKDETLRKPVKWRSRSNFSSYLNDGNTDPPR